MKQRSKIMTAVCLLVTTLSVVVSSAPYSSAADSAEPAKQTDAAKPADAGVSQAGAQQPSANAAAAADKTASGTSSAALHKVADNARLEMYVDDQTGGIRVVDKITKKEWLGAPPLDSKALPTEKKFTGSPLMMKYTEGADIVSTYSLKDPETKAAVKAIDGGARVSFTFGKEKISVDVEYRLRQDGIEAAIPYDSIKEQGAARLISLELLPFFQAAGEKDAGAIFLPDGSGALIEFRPNHPPYLKGYSEPVYGPDDSFVTQSHDKLDKLYRHAKSPRETIAMPVFGLYRNNTGFLGIITQGEQDALINGTPAGIRNIALYRTSAELLYRKSDVIFIGSSGQIPYYQGAKTPGDRKVRYILLQGSDAGYVGMAKAYRRYLTDEAGVKPAAAAAPALQLQLLGGILRDEMIGTTFVAMTAFQQARSMIDAYAAKGLVQLEITYDGWSDGGLLGNQPDHFPVDKHLGGSARLKELAQYAKSKGIALYLSANYMKAYGKSDGFSKNSDGIRGIDRAVMASTDYYVSTNWSINEDQYYLLKPSRTMDRHIAKELGSFAGLGIAGVHLKGMGDTLYSDQDPKQPSSRKQTADVWVKAMDSFRGAVGKTAVDYGYAYALGHVDRIDRVPIDSSHYDVTDRAVPFYQIVVHGLVPYSAKPGNLRDDSSSEQLKMLEYGAMPSYSLTYAPTSDLQRTRAQNLFSTGYADWMDTSLEEFQKLSALYGKTASQPIVNHERLSADIYRTTYANGTRVTVNYNAKAGFVDGVSIPGLGYAATEGGTP